MPRPLFEIAREISANWDPPAPQAKTYLKGMYYLLGMDDRVADLDAMMAVRMFLLFSRDWTGPVAERIKAELSAMRSAHTPTNMDLLATNNFPIANLTIATCQLCDAPLGEPAKFVEAHTHWGACARMCMHCNLCLSPGVDIGDGAIYITGIDGAWRHLHGTPNPAPAAANLAKAAETISVVNGPVRLKLRHRVKLFGRRAAKKCLSIVRRLFRKSA